MPCSADSGKNRRLRGMPLNRIVLKMKPIRFHEKTYDDRSYKSLSLILHVEEIKIGKMIIKK